MGRFKGLAPFSANFEPQMAAPLDARAIVDTKADLTTTSVWQANDGLVYTYVGMVVYVIANAVPADRGLYTLDAADYTQAANWTKLGTGGSSVSEFTLFDITGATRTIDSVNGFKVVTISSDNAGDNAIGIDVDGTVAPEGSILVIHNKSGLDSLVNVNGTFGFVLMGASTATDFTSHDGEVRIFYAGSDNMYEISNNISNISQRTVDNVVGSRTISTVTGVTSLHVTTNISGVTFSDVAGAYENGAIIVIYNEAGGPNTFGVAGGITFKLINDANTTSFAMQDGEARSFVVQGTRLVELSNSALASGLVTRGDTTVITVGGIPSGTTITSWDLETLIDRLLYPELFPTLTAPSSTFTSTVTGLREIGETIASITFTSTLNRGSISPQYTALSPLRSGPANQHNLTGSGLVSIVSTNLTETATVNNYVVLLGAQSWTGSVSYDEGVQPKSSKDNDYNTPLAAGTTGVVTRTITGVYPYFGTSVAIITMTKQALVAHNSTYFEINMVGESGGNKQTVQLPDAFSNITGIQFYNTVSSAWEWIGGNKANSLLTFTLTTTTLLINGNNVNYDVLTHNGSNVGARNLRFYTN